MKYVVTFVIFVQSISRKREKEKYVYIYDNILTSKKKEKKKTTLIFRQRYTHDRRKTISLN